MTTIRIAISVGDPAGIGPDIVLAAAQRAWPAQLVAIADRTMLSERAAALGLDVDLIDYREGEGSTAGKGTAPDTGTRRLLVLDEPLAVPVTAGIGDPRNAAGVLSALRRAVAGCESGEFAALVTAPVNKAMIADSGVPFLGHT
jgi:4-hydroxythreonine-4-phosphate dehydrogenase